jgi:hypothetical protein
MTNRGIFNIQDNNAELDELMAQLKAAIESGSAADSAEVMALQAQIDAVNAKADQAEATGQNARDMVLKRDPRISTLEGLADQLGGAVNAGNGEHARLDQRIDQIQLAPGPAGKDGVEGKPGLDGKAGTNGTNGTNGTDGLTAYQVARASGYGGTQAQWLASLVGPKGDIGPAGPVNLQIEYRDGVAVPAITSLLGISASVDVTITWPTAFADATYIVTPQVSTTAGGLVGKTAVAVKSKTAAACVVTVTTTALLSAGQATLSAIAYRKA